MAMACTSGVMDRLTMAIGKMENSMEVATTSRKTKIIQDSCRFEKVYGKKEKESTGMTRCQRKKFRPNKNNIKI